MLTFALEHEFEMNRIYQEISSHFRVPTNGEKHDIMYSAKEVSIKRLTTTHGELFENKQLMHQLSRTQPLLPKPYAERAMLLYLAANLSQLSSRGIKSSGTNRESFGMIYTRSSWGRSFLKGHMNYLSGSFSPTSGTRSQGYG
jgi:hypothetical protein